MTKLLKIIPEVLKHFDGRTKGPPLGHSLWLMSHAIIIPYIIHRLHPRSNYVQQLWYSPRHTLASLNARLLSSALSGPTSLKIRTWPLGSQVQSSVTRHQVKDQSISEIDHFPHLLKQGAQRINFKPFFFFLVIRGKLLLICSNTVYRCDQECKRVKRVWYGSCRVQAQYNFHTTRTESLS